MTTRNFKKYAPLNFIGLLFFLSFIMASCSDDEEPLIEMPTPTATSEQVANIPFFVVTENGELPSSPEDLLYDVRMKNPILSPDGHHVSWEEFSAVRGSISVECMEEGTYVNFRVTGLIPNGVYSAWNVTVKEPGFDPAAEMFNITGIGASGKGDGSDNTFLANPDGTAELTVISPGGALSMFGEIGNCALTDQFEWHMVAAYHIDGKTYGADLGPDGTVVEQFGFIFNRDN